MHSFDAQARYSFAASRRGVLLAVLLCVFVTACDRADRNARQAEKDTRPNFLFVISDDQSWVHTSRAGYGLVSTPHFDRIANEGLYFPNAFVSAPSCTPSRSAILAGQDFWRLKSGGLLWGEYPASMISYQDILKDAGYAVGYTGKGWGPGFISRRGVQPTGEEYNQIKGARSGVIGEWDLVANFAGFLDEKPAAAPFSFWVGSIEPHRPYDESIANRFTAQNTATHIPPFLPDTITVQSQLSGYLDEIERFDRDLGALLQLLKDRGYLDNTIVVVTSDNGMEFSRGKPTLYAYGVRVPLAIYWAKMAGSRTIDEFVSLTDIAPTFLAAAGLPIPGDMTGTSLLPVLSGAAGAQAANHRDAVFVGYERHAGYIREGNLTYPSRAIYTPKFTYIRNYFPDRWPVGDPPGYVEAILWLLQDPESGEYLEPYFSLVASKRPAEELYDLRADPYQLNNVIGEPGYSASLAELRDRLTDRLLQTKDPVEMSGADIFTQYKYFAPVK